MIRIVFMGTAEFGVPTLRALCEKNDVAGVVTRSDSKMGRGRKLQPSPVKIAAKELSLEVLEPVNLTDTEFIKNLKEFEADLFLL